MKRQIVALVVTLAIVASADDSVTIRHIGGSLPSVSNSIVRTVKGQAFENIRHDVERIVSHLGSQKLWSDYGPDASHQSAEIVLGGNSYTINSWYPLHCQDETIAISEKWGLMSVSGRAEKTKIERQNSERYRALVSIFDLCRKEPQQSAPRVPGSRGTPPADAGGAPRDPAGEP